MQIVHAIHASAAAGRGPAARLPSRCGQAVRPGSAHPAMAGSARRGPDRAGPATRTMKKTRRGCWPRSRGSAAVSSSGWLVLEASSSTRRLNCSHGQFPVHENAPAIREGPYRPPETLSRAGGSAAGPVSGTVVGDDRLDQDGIGLRVVRRCGILRRRSGPGLRGRRGGLRPPVHARRGARTVPAPAGRRRGAGPFAGAAFGVRESRSSSPGAVLAVRVLGGQSRFPAPRHPYPWRSRPDSTSGKRVFSSTLIKRSAS